MRRMLADAASPANRIVYRSQKCQIWWQTVPSLPRDPRNPEDVDSTAPDHAPDACRIWFVIGTKCQKYRLPKLFRKMNCHSAPINAILKGQRETQTKRETLTHCSTPCKLLKLPKRLNHSKTSALTNHLLIPMPRTL